MKRALIGTIVIGVSSIVFSEGAMAQVVPDGTLQTTVTQPIINQFDINGGVRSGNNLFHSFSQFSVPTGGSAIFNNALDVQNIFSRVTGFQPSDIDGILKTQGNANLFLMNPNGIVFGKNAQLQLGGSFLGTTANSIKFADSIEFNTANATPALLSVNLPIGLQMGANPGNITVQGAGHQLSTTFATANLRFNTTPVGLQISQGQTLALVGGNITLASGILTAEGGRLELGAVQQKTPAFVRLRPEGNRWALDYGEIQQFGDIELRQQALLNASGSGNGTIQIQAKNLIVKDGSAVIWENRGTQTGQGINLRATDTIQLLGRSPRGFDSSIYSDAIAIGSTGNLNISTPKLVMKQGSTITSRTFSSADGGNININAATAELSATNATSNQIATRTLGTGKGGNLTLNAQKLSIQGGGGLVASVNNAAGAGGKLIINATESIDLTGGPNGIPAQAILSSSTVGGAGNSGDLIVNTRRLTLRNGGVISASTFGRGDGGNIMVNASESIEISGKLIDPNSGFLRSAIRGAGILFPATTRRIFGLPDTVTGKAGNVTINTPRLQVSDAAEISVQHGDRGNAGNLVVQSGVVSLDRQGRIVANTASGEGGNLTLKLTEQLSLRNGSFISTEAKGSGNGGNITIDAPIIVGLENSDIIANAVKGRGGNIKIATQSLFGIQYRTALTAANDITASSEFGINGNVQVSTIGINPANALNELPSDVTDSSRQIADRCGTSKTSSFIATGRGGMPQGPTMKQGSDRPWNDLRPTVTTNATTIQPIARSQPLVEASAIEVDATGAIALVAAKPAGVQTVATCGIGAVQ